MVNRDEEVIQDLRDEVTLNLGTPGNPETMEEIQKGLVIENVLIVKLFDSSEFIFSRF